MKIFNWLVVFLLFISIGCFLPAAHAEEQNKDVPPKSDHTMPGSTKAGPPMPGPTKAVPPMRGPTIAGPQMTNTPHRQHGEDNHEYEHRDGRHRADFHHFTGRNYHHWEERERAIWRSGAWRHEKYMGRYGWWWITGGMLYFYEEPVYPYPLVVPDVVYELPVDDQPPPEYSQQPPEDPDYWYYCEDPKGYYPYITECPGGWMTVVPQPAAPDQ